jgi:hypothetical protein
MDAFVVYCLALTVVSIAVLLYVTLDYHPLAGFALFTFPVTMVPFYWIGQDGLTLLLMLGIVLNLHNRWSWLGIVRQ